MKRTKQQRLLAIVDHYQAKLVGGRPVTMDEVAEWALKQELWPTPGVRDPPAVGDAWDARFEKLKTEAAHD